MGRESISPFDGRLGEDKMSKIKDWIESQIEWKHETDSLDDPDMMVDPALQDECVAEPEVHVGGSTDEIDANPSGGAAVKVPTSTCDSGAV